MSLKNKSLKVILVVVFLFASIGFFNFNTPTVKAMTSDEIKALIIELQAKIVELQKQLAEITGGEVAWCYDFDRNLKYGNSGEEVRALQTALEKQGFYKRTITGNFDEYTASAVVGFQEKYKEEVLGPWGLEHGTGFVGTTTRKKLNELYGCGKIPPIEPEKCITVLSPNGSEKWVAGQNYDITWSSSAVDKIDIFLADDRAGRSYQQIALEISASSGKYSWTIPSDIGLSATHSPCFKVWIHEIAGKAGTEGITDESDNYFSIVETSTTNLPPVIDGLTTPTQLKVNETGSWVIKAHDPENGQLTYNVNWGDENVIRPLSSSLEGTQATKFTHSYSKIGTYTITFTVTDNQGQKAETSTTLRVVSTTCHTTPLWDWDYCSSDCKCYAGEGDCDTDADCYSGYCAQDVGSKYGQVSSMDVCETKIISTCSESDNYQDFYTKGTTMLSTGEEKTDYCIDDNTLKEYWCSGMGGVAWIDEIDYTCPYGCEDGACKPGIMVTSPNGSEEWMKGNTYTVKWESKGIDKVRIYIFNPNISGSGSTNYIVPDNQSVSASSGYYNWTIGEVGLPLGVGQGAVYKIRIDDVDSTLSDKSDDYFSIVEPEKSITVLSPNGGETLSEGSEYTIKWGASGLPNDAKVYITLFRTGDANMSIVSNLPATQREYVWKVTTANDWGYPCFGKGTKVLMESGTYKNIENISLGEYVVSFGLQKKKFENSKVVEIIQREDSVIIINQKLKIVPDQMIYVNGEFKIAKDVKIGDSLLDEKGETVKVYSVKQNLEKKIETYDFVLEGFQNFFAEGYLVHSAPGLEEFGRVYSVLNSNQSSAISYQIMVSASWGTWGTNYYGNVYDRSDGWFYINPSTCTDSDNGKDYYMKGTAVGYGGATLIDSCCTDINDKFCGKSTGSVLSEAYCRTDGTPDSVQYTCPYGCSDGACKPGITVLSPNGGEKWVIGNTYDITWDSGGIDKIAILVDGNVEADAVLASLGKYSWEIFGPESSIPGPYKTGEYKVRIEDISDSSIYDESNNYFSIIESVTCTDLELDTSADYYFDICRNAGYDKICFDKYTSEYQGCGKSSYDDCTTHNTNAARNIWCNTTSE